MQLQNTSVEQQTTPYYFGLICVFQCCERKLHFFGSETRFTLGPSISYPAFWFLLTFNCLSDSNFFSTATGSISGCSRGPFLHRPGAERVLSGRGQVTNPPGRELPTHQPGPPSTACASQMSKPASHVRHDSQQKISPCTATTRSVVSVCILFVPQKQRHTTSTQILEPELFDKARLGQRKLRVPTSFP